MLHVPAAAISNSWWLMTVQKKKDSTLIFGAIVACYAVYVSMKIRVFPSKRRESIQDLPFLSVYNNSKTRVVSLSRIRAEFQQHIANFRKRIRKDSLASAANFDDFAPVSKHGDDGASHLPELEMHLPEVISTMEMKELRGTIGSFDGRDRSRKYIPTDSPKPTKLSKTPLVGLQNILVSPPCKGVPGTDEESSDSVEVDMTPVHSSPARREILVDTPTSSSVKKPGAKTKRRSSSVGDASTVQATLKHQQIQEILRQHTDQSMGLPKNDSMARREVRGHLLKADNTDQWRSQSIDEMYQEMSEELVRQKRMADDEENSDDQGSPPTIGRINAKERRVSFKQTTPPAIQRASTHDNLWKKRGKDAQLESMQTRNNDMSLQIENLQRQLDMMKDSMNSGIEFEEIRDRVDLESVMSYEPSLVMSRQSSEQKPESIAGDPHASLAPTTPAGLEEMSPASARSERADSVFMVGSAPGIPWLGLTASDAANSEMDDSTRRETRGNLATRANISMYRDQSIRRELGDMEKEVRRLEMDENDSNRRESRGNLATRANIGLYRDQSIRRELTDMEKEVRRLQLEAYNNESKPVFRKFQSSPAASAISSRRSSAVPEAGMATSQSNTNNDVCMTQLDIANIYIEELMKKVVELEEKLEAVSASAVNPLMRPAMIPNESNMSNKRMPSTFKPNMGPVSLIPDQWELEPDLPEGKDASFNCAD